jgi:hypothetical protein
MDFLHMAPEVVDMFEFDVLAFRMLASNPLLTPFRLLAFD